MCQSCRTCCACCYSWLGSFCKQLPRSATSLLAKGLTIFSALSLYYLIETLLHFPSEKRTVWSPAFATAIFLLLTTHFFTPCLVQLKLGAGNLVLELLAEMDGWAWVSAFQEVIVRNGDPDERVDTALKFIGFLLLTTPFYLSMNSLLRDRFQLSLKLKRKLAKFDSSIVGYVLGFSLQVLIGALVYQLISQGDATKEYICFSLELVLVVVIVYYLERLRLRASTLNSLGAAVLTLVIDVAERAFSIALGFAWLHAYKPLYDTLVVNAYGDDLEADDATWLEVSTEEGGKQHGGDADLIRKQARLGLVWLLLVFLWAALSHAVLETNAKRRKVQKSQDNDHAELTISNLSLEEARRKKRQVIQDFGRTVKRMRTASLSLAFGFAIAKTLGDLFLNGFGWNSTGQLWANNCMAAFVPY